MASAGSIDVELTADYSGLQGAFNRASDIISKFGYSMNGKITEGLVDPLKKAKFEFKDVSRIVGGIIISKAFYSGLNAIRNATNAVVDFRQELEYTEVALSNLFDSTETAEELVNVLKDMSAVSPFDFETSAKAAQRLLAYGIQAKNVMYVMQGVMNAATMQGDPSKIESISRALGQIYTKGTLKAEELRQLAEAGIPAYEILAEKLNISAKAMGNIGKAGIPASVAINALVDGINERFSGMADASVLTMKGMVSNIKDNLLMLASDAFDPLYQQIRTVTKALNDFFSEMYQIAEVKGLGGVFERLVPDKTMQASLRQFIALMQEFGAVLLDVGRNIRAVFIASLQQLINIVNAIGPYFVMAGQIIQLFASEIRNCAPLMNALTTVLATSAGAFIVFKAAAMGAFLLKPLTGVVMACAKAFSILGAIITAHPLVLGLMLLGGAIAGLASTSTKAGEAVRNFGQSVTKWLGIDPGKKLLPDTKKRTAEVDKFNQALDTTADKLDKTGDEAEKAAKKGKKAQKDLLSFDEVFRLQDKDETTGTGADTPDWSMPDMDFGDIGMDEPQLPSFADLWESAFQKRLKELKNWAKNLWQRVCDALGLDDPNTALFASAMGTGIASILAALLGAPMWEVLAAGLLGFVAGLVWEKIAEAFGMDQEKKYEAAICTAFGIAFGALIAALLGFGPLTTVIASLGAGLAAEIWAGICDACGISPEAKYAGLIAGGITALLAAAFANPIIGAKIAELAPGLWSIIQKVLGGATPAAGLFNAATTAALVATTITAIVNGFKTGDWSGLIPAIAGVLGRLALGPLGGWAGMIAGYLYNATYEKLKEKFGLSNAFKFGDIFSALFTALGTGIASWMAPVITAIGEEAAAGGIALANGFKGGIIGAIASIGASAISNILLNWMAEALDLTDKDVKNGKIGGQIGGIGGSIIGGIVGFLAGGPAGAAIGIAVGTGIGTPLGTALGAIWDTKIYPALSTLGTNISNFFTKTLPTFFASIPGTIGKAALDFGVALAGFVDKAIVFFTQTLPNAVGEKVGYALGFILGKIALGFASIKEAWDTFWNETLPNTISAIQKWFASLPEKFFNWALKIGIELIKGIMDLKTKWDTFWNETLPNTLTSIQKWFTSLPEKFFNWAIKIGIELAKALFDIKGKWDTFWDVTLPNTLKSIQAWFTSLPGKVFNWMIKIGESIVKAIKDLPDKLKDIGKKIVQGLLDGLSAPWNAIVNFIKGFCDGFIQGFKDALGIASPSTVFSDIGGYIIDGLLQGLTNAFKSITDWISTAVTTIIDGFKSISDAVASFASSAKENISGFASSAKEKISGFVSSTKEKISGWTSSCKEKISGFVSSAKEKISGWVSSTKEKISGWVSSTKEKISGWASSAKEKISGWTSSTKEKISGWASSVKEKISSWSSSTKEKVKSWVSSTKENISSFTSSTKDKFKTWASSVKTTISGLGTSIKTNLKNAFTSVKTSISNSLSSIKSKVESFATSIGTKLSNLVTKAQNGATSIGNKIMSATTGHATGGVFNREHVAHIAEGNKAEAIIPLEDRTAMQPFVDAVSQGLSQYLGPMMANMSNAISSAGATSGGGQQPLYVGTLIADERSLRELQRKMDVIQLKESRRTS